MKLLRFAGGVALAVTMSGIAAQAVTLQQAAKPAERPPASYTGDVYVDSRGCAYARAEIGNTVNWVPRLAADRKTVICGLTPTAKVASMARATPPPPPAPPPPSAIAAATTAQAPAATNTPLPTTPAADPAPAGPAPISRTISVTCPADGSRARVRIGASTVAVQCSPNQATPARYVVRDAQGTRTRLIVNPPERTVVAQAAEPVPAAPTSNSRVIIGGTTPVPAERSTTRVNPNGGYTFGNGYGLSDGPGAADPVPRPGAVPTAPVATPNAPGPLPGSGSGNGFGNGYELAPVPDAGQVVIPDGYRAAWDDDRLNPQRGPRSAYGDQQMARTVTIDQVPMRTVNAAPAQGLIAPRRTVIGPVISTKSPSATATVATQTAPTRRYVQVGMFTVPGNAQRAAAKLQNLGLPGRVAQTASGKTVVIAGPYGSVAAVNAALATAQRGFPDAFLRN